MSAWVMVVLAAAADAGVEPLVEAKAVVADLQVDLRYATADNFMKKQVYPADARCLLLQRSAQMLAQAAAALRQQGLVLKVYDCYRPHSVQYELWKVMPVPGYVADPKTGSNHNRGGAVDLTLALPDGGGVEMPSAYDFFGPAAHHGYAGGTARSRGNRETLKAAMERAGFSPNKLEWWHYDLPDAAKFPLRDEPFTADGGVR